MALIGVGLINWFPACLQKIGGASSAGGRNGCVKSGYRACVRRTVLTFNHINDRLEVDEVAGRSSPDDRAKLVKRPQSITQKSRARMQNGSNEELRTEHHQE